MLRTLFLLVLAVLLAVLAGIGAYVYVVHHIHGGTWGMLSGAFGT